MKNKKLVCLLCVLLILAVVFIQYPSEIEIISVAASYSNVSDDYKEQIIEANQSLTREHSGNLVCVGNGSIIRSVNVFQRENVFCLIPYITAQARPVGTAGSTSWWFAPKLLIIDLVNPSKERTYAVSMDSSSFRLEADENTTLDFKGNAVDYALDKSNWNVDEESFLEIQAMTIDSTDSRNASCNLMVNWDGNMNYHVAPFYNCLVPFEISTSISYENNV